MFEAWDELSSYKIRSSVGAGARRPSKAGANEVAGEGAILVGIGAGFAVGTTESAGGGGADTSAGATKG